MFERHTADGGARASGQGVRIVPQKASFLGNSTFWRRILREMRREGRQEQKGQEKYGIEAKGKLYYVYTGRTAF